MRRPLRFVALVISATAVSASSPPATAAQSGSLAEARAATARYHDHSAAATDGFVPQPECVALPTGGAMGVHHMAFSRMDAEVTAGEPEILLYEPGEDGDRLVGVEYVVVGNAEQAPPTLFGESFHRGPPVGDGRVLWVLHVWLWRHNPGGLFADFNPRVRCPAP